MHVSEKTLAALGFDDLRAALSARCRTELGKAKAALRPFLASLSEVEAAYALSKEAVALKEEPLILPIAGLTDVRSPVDHAKRGAMLEPQPLMAICQHLFSFERVHEIFAERKERYRLLYDRVEFIPQLPRLASRLDKSFEASGEISDRASEELRAARERARGAHRRIRARLDELLKDERFASNLQENYYSVRNDRYVVPVKSSHQHDVDGLVHNASQTGQTLFVEPKEMIHMGNELAIAQAAVLEEERRVLIELSGLVGREADKILLGIESLSALDEAEAVATLTKDLSANFPKVVEAPGPLILKYFSHPRLTLRGTPVIANSIEMTDARGLVVSGPNAGGKTITLTGVGLAALMVRAGLPIPCDADSVVPLFTSVHASIGDQQDLSQGLSTFSGHVAALKTILSTVSIGGLVLVDEIAADTDPREGAAIAIAVLETLLEQHATVLVTTHLEELKALAHVDARFVNARVGFDQAKMTPTYRLQFGSSGASSAIDIAKKVGLPEAICERARLLSNSSGGALSQALAASQEEYRKYNAFKEAAADASKEAEELRNLLAQQAQDFERRRKEDELKFRSALKAELDFAKTELNKLIDVLEKDKSDKALKRVSVASDDLAARVLEQATQEKKLKQELSMGIREMEVLEFKVGAKARLTSLDAVVEIVEVHDSNTITVALGSIKKRVKNDELSPVEKTKTKSKYKATLSVESVSAAPLTVSSPKIDVRGERSDEALRRIERFLDDAMRKGEPQAVVVHGHGTGALKKDVREYLKLGPYAKSFRPGDANDGGDGVTVISL
jgi:DNA mismatch repair protein MutS2